MTILFAVQAVALLVAIVGMIVANARDKRLQIKRSGLTWIFLALFIFVMLSVIAEGVYGLLRSS